MTLHGPARDHEQFAFSLICFNAGRLLSDFTHKLHYDDLLEDAEKVLRDLTPIEREVDSVDRRSFIARLWPYRTVDNRIDGVVLTFVEITELRKALENLEESDRFRARTVTRADVEARVRSWIAHAEHADSWRLRDALFRGGWFDPAGKKPKKSGRPRDRRRKRS
ncbi:MAG: PAS domain-containing protein [Dichotomicrobium sp.]